MDSEYQKWWRLHVRIARGETLTQDEQALYSAGIERFDSEEAGENQFSDLTTLRQLRIQVQTLTQNLSELTARSELLSGQITELEQTYQQLTGYSLLLDSNASP